jgi:hypothetical protein
MATQSFLYMIWMFHLLNETRYTRQGDYTKVPILEEFFHDTRTYKSELGTVKEWLDNFLKCIDYKMIPRDCNVKIISEGSMLPKLLIGDKTVEQFLYDNGWVNSNMI